MKPRNPWLAGFLNLLVLGLGYVYAGRVKRAGYLVGIWLLVYFITGFSGILATMQGFFASSGLLLGIKLLTVADAFRAAKKNPLPQQQPYMKAAVYVAYVVVILMLPMAPAQHQSEWFGYDRFSVTSDTMAPTVQMGDTILADTWFYHDHKPQVGEIVVVEVEPDLQYIRRVQSVSDAGITFVSDGPNPAPSASMTLPADHLVGRVVGVIYSHTLDRIGLKIAQPD